MLCVGGLFGVYFRVFCLYTTPFVVLSESPVSVRLEQGYDF